MFLFELFGHLVAVCYGGTHDDDLSKTMMMSMMMNLMDETKAMSDGDVLLGRVHFGMRSADSINL